MWGRGGRWGPAGFGPGRARMRAYPALYARGHLQTGFAPGSEQVKAQLEAIRYQLDELEDYLDAMKEAEED